MKSTNIKGALYGALSVCAYAPVLAQETIEHVIVTGVPIEQSADDLAQSVTVIGGEALDRIRAANLGETLAGELGVSASYFGAGASRPIIRGLAGPRVRMMEDGIDSLDVSTVSDDHAVSIDPVAAEQIEIFRGPTTLLYGSGAVGGVINTVTNRIPEGAPADGFDGTVEVRGDTVADDRTLSLALDGGGDRVAWHVDALTRETGNYEIPGFAEEEEEHEEIFGILENSNIEADSVAGGLSWLGDSAFFGVSLGTFDTNYGLPGHHEHHDEEEPGAEEEEELPVRLDLEQTRYDIKGGWLGLDGPIEAINLRLGVVDYEHLELEGSEVGTRFDNDAWEARLEFLLSDLGQWRGAFGLQHTEREFSAIGEEAFVPPVDTSSLGLFLIEQRETERWQLSLGARLESQEHDPSGGLPRADDSAASVSFAAIRDLGNGFSLAMNLANAERLPVADELYANGPHLATGNIEIGDPALGSETSRHLDFGIRKTEGDLTWTVTTFVTDYDDYIYLRDTGVIDPDEELPVFAFSQANADFVGVEAELFMPIANLGNGEIDLRLFGDLVRAELASGERLPRIPPRRFGARLQYHDERLVAGIEATRHDRQDKTATYETPTPGYTMLNADLRLTVGDTMAATYEIFLRGTNLLDEDARRHTSFLKDIAPLPGRNYALGFRVSF
ncbi:MAG TPA: TonB-dependent receptor [Gammaproteobacteria bacterium]|nr:TonB-dependent receptor [Gammaproteobacteria bacterium]